MSNNHQWKVSQTSWAFHIFLHILLGSQLQYLIKLYFFPFLLCWALVLKIITLQSQVKQLQRLLSNSKEIKSTEVARKYHQHWILRSSVKLSLLHSDTLHMKNKYIWTLNLSQSSEMILQPRRTSCRNISVSWMRWIKQMPSWVSKEEAWWRKYEMSEISWIYFSVFLSSENNWSDQPTQKSRSRKAKWGPNNVCYSHWLVPRFTLTLLRTCISRNLFLSWSPPAFSRSQRTVEDKSGGALSRSG